MPLVTGTELARFAENVATARTSDRFLELSGLMCWDGVIRCALDANAISRHRARQLSWITWREDFSMFVSRDDARVQDADEMRRVPAGAFVAFIEVEPPDRLNRGFGVPEGRRHIIHAMVSLGNGLAAGNKNSAIGIGESVGWEVLDLAGRLNWRPGNHRLDPINAYPVHVQSTRPIRIRYRELTEFQEPGARASDQRYEIPTRITLNRGKARQVRPGEFCEVGPLSGDCVALAAVKPSTSDAGSSRSSRGGGVFLWHVAERGMASDRLPRRELSAFLDGQKADWYFVHSRRTWPPRRATFAEQKTLVELVGGAESGRATGPNIRHFVGNRLLVDSAGDILNEQELQELTL